MGNPIADDTILESRDNRTLADDLTKGLGTGFSGKNEIRHATPGLERISIWWSGKKNDSRVTCNTQRGSLPLLPSGPGGVRDSMLRRARLSKSNSYLAERVRFELTVLSYTRFPGVHLKPLGHLSFSNALKNVR